VVLSQQETKRKIGEGVGPGAREVMWDWKKLAHPVRNQTKGQNEEQQHQDPTIESHLVGL